MTDPIVVVSRWLRPHLPEISLAIVGTLLMLFGTPLIRLCRPALKRMPTVLRVVLFTLLCSFGVAGLCTWGVRFVNSFLGSVSNGALSLVVVGVFALVGYLAQREKFL